MVNAVVVFFSPHADDAEIAAGALMRWLVDQGIRVVVMVLYPGHRCSSRTCLGKSSTTIAAERIQENERACCVTGAELVYMDLAAAYEAPGYQPNRVEIRRLTRWIRRLKPAVVFVPPRFDPHGGHQAGRATAATALPLAGCPQIEVITYDSAWGGLGGDTPANMYFAYDARLGGIKDSAIECFQTQQLDPTDLAGISRSKAQMWRLHLPELVDRHHSLSSAMPDGMVGCEVFRREVLDVIRTQGPWADPIHVALLEMEHQRSDGVQQRGGRFLRTV
jgi:LmbE family N-acetylglucosaminyl deacetylase